MIIFNTVEFLQNKFNHKKSAACYFTLKKKMKCLQYDTENVTISYK